MARDGNIQPGAHLTKCKDNVKLIFKYIRRPIGCEYVGQARFKLRCRVSQHVILQSDLFSSGCNKVLFSNINKFNTLMSSFKNCNNIHKKK
jgi:hypothetical protein